MRSLRNWIGFGTCILILTSPANSGAIGFETTRATIDAGGTTYSVGGEFALACTLGQPDAVYIDLKNNDPNANNTYRVEDKPADDRGRYRYPGGYGKGDDSSVKRLTRTSARSTQKKAARDDDTNSRLDEESRSPFLPMDARLSTSVDRLTVRRAKTGLRF